MQNPDTGEMMPLSRDLARAILGAVDERKECIPIFEVGEEIEIRGGRFRIEAICTDGLVLKGVARVAPSDVRSRAAVLLKEPFEVAHGL
jgi:hypothetical protein